MNTIDLTPLYRNSVGFDRFGSLLDTALRGESQSVNYPPYNIEVTGENQYAISIAVAGFNESDLTISVERGVLKVSGKRADDTQAKKHYLHQGIATRAFERKFNLADHVEVQGAELVNGLLVISLLKELPEAEKPKTIPIKNTAAIEQNRATEQAA